MKEAIALIIVMLMGAFAATKAEGYFIHPTHSDLLTPIYASIDDQHGPTKNRSSEIAQLGEAIQTQQNTYVSGALSQVMLYLIALENQRDTTQYKAFLK